MKIGDRLVEPTTNSVFEITSTCCTSSYMKLVDPLLPSTELISHVSYLKHIKKILYIAPDYKSFLIDNKSYGKTFIPKTKAGKILYDKSR